MQDEEFPAPSPGPQKGASVLNRTSICKIGVGALVLRSVFGPIGSKARFTTPRYVKHTQAQKLFQKIIDLQPTSLITKMVHLASQHEPPPSPQGVARGEGGGGCPMPRSQNVEILICAKSTLATVVDLGAINLQGGQ